MYANVSVFIFFVLLQAERNHFTSVYIFNKNIILSCHLLNYVYSLRLVEKWVSLRCTEDFVTLLFMIWPLSQYFLQVIPPALVI